MKLFEPVVCVAVCFSCGTVRWRGGFGGLRWPIWDFDGGFGGGGSNSG